MDMRGGLRDQRCPTLPSLPSQSPLGGLGSGPKGPTSKANYSPYGVGGEGLGEGLGPSAPTLSKREEMAKRPHHPGRWPSRTCYKTCSIPETGRPWRLRQRIRQVWEAMVPAAHAGPRPPGGPEAPGALGGGERQHLGQELQFLKPRILEELDRTLGPGKVRDLRLRVGKLKRRGQASRGQLTPGKVCRGGWRRPFKKCLTSKLKGRKDLIKLPKVSIRK